MNDKPRERDDDPAGPVEIEEGHVGPDEILAVRRGPGANCSSIGSALDLLFVSATLAGVVMAGIAAALGKDEGEDGKAAPRPREGQTKEGGDAGAR